MPHDALAPATTINLAHTPGFRLGVLELRPATRQAVRGDVAELVEPRVMQLLVALAEARGEVVSRDDLIKRCWGGAAVGDNAIHRVVSRLREIAAGLGEGSFSIETVPRVGYRLIAPETAGASPPAMPAALFAPRLRPWLVAGCVALLVAAAITLWSIWPRAQRPLAFAVIADPQTGSENEARSLAAELAPLLARRASRLSIAGPGGARTAEYWIRLASQRDAANVRAEVTLVGSNGAELLWSGRFERPAGEAGLLQRQIASQLGALLLCASRPRDVGQLDGDDMRQLLAICARLDGPTNESLVSLLQGFLARRPDFGWAWGELALAQAELASEPVGNRAERLRALQVAARQSIARARALNPDLATVWLAEHHLLAPMDWQPRIQALDAGRAADDGEARLYIARSLLFQGLGFVEASVDNAHHAVERDPLSHKARNVLIGALAYAGQAAAAQRALEEAERLWPGSPVVAEVRRRFDLRYGDPAVALDTTAGSLGYGRLQQLFLQARARPSPTNVEAAVASARRAAMGGSGPPIWYVQTLATFGRVDEFYALVSDPEVVASLGRGSHILFRHHMRPVWLDRRFIDLTARIGLARFWMARNVWPTFCSDPQLGYDCRTEARRALAATNPQPTLSSR